MNDYAYDYDTGCVDGGASDGYTDTSYTYEEPVAYTDTSYTYEEPVAYTDSSYTYEEPVAYTDSSYTYEEPVAYTDSSYTYEEPVAYTDSSYTYEEPVTYTDTTYYEVPASTNTTYYDSPVVENSDSAATVAALEGAIAALEQLPAGDTNVVASDPFTIAGSSFADGPGVTPDLFYIPGGVWPEHGFGNTISYLSNSVTSGSVASVDSALLHTWGTFTAGLDRSMSNMLTGTSWDTSPPRLD